MPPMLINSGTAPTPTCNLCNDYGTVARRIGSGSYVCAGPVPEDANRVWEDFCECEEGQRMRLDDRRAWASAAQ